MTRIELISIIAAILMSGRINEGSDVDEGLAEEAATNAARIVEAATKLP